MEDVMTDQPDTSRRDFVAAAVKRLANPAYLVEIDVIAVLPPKA